MDSSPTVPVPPPVKTEPGLEATRPVVLPRRAGLLAWWVWPLGIACALGILVIVWAAILFAPVPVQPAGAAQPLFTVYPPPSFTPVLPSATFTPFFTPTIGVPTAQPGTIGVGALVEVTEDGLRLRDAPTTSGTILYQADAHEIFRVIDGPRQADGYTWWQLQGVYNTDLRGWAVENYLKPTD
jgi:hypothetical protein